MDMKKINEYGVFVITMSIYVAILSQVFLCDMALENVWPFQNESLREYATILLRSSGIHPVEFGIAGRIADILLFLMPIKIFFFLKKEKGEKRKA